MKFRLKTYEQIEREFRPYSDMWKKTNTTVRIKYDNFDWYINNEMFGTLGGIVELKEIPEGRASLKNYTHENIHTGKAGYKWVWHKSWFMPELEDFFKEDDFKL